eukprot:IDg22452t1
MAVRRGAVLAAIDMRPENYTLRLKDVPKMARKATVRKITDYFRIFKPQGTFRVLKVLDKPMNVAVTRSPR